MVKLMIAGLFTNFKLPPFVGLFGVIVPLDTVVLFAISTLALFLVLYLFLGAKGGATRASRVQLQSKRARIAFAQAQSRAGGPMH